MRPEPTPSDPAVVTIAGDELEVRSIQPYQARKAYSCPGCNQEITVGTGHLVVVPRLAPEDRRHWHRPCWDNRRTRRPTTRR